MDGKQENSLKRAWRRSGRKKSPALMAYLLGFGCHYILDSTCHPYVNQVAAEGKVSHTLFEKEFDRMLMYETGKDPLRFLSVSWDPCQFSQCMDDPPGTTGDPYLEHLSVIENDEDIHLYFGM